MSKQSYYYVTGNTSQGFVNYLSTNIENINQITILKHDSHTLKTAVLQQLQKKLSELNEPLEIICSPFGKSYLEGIVVRGLSLAILTDTVMTPTGKEYKEIELANFISVQHSYLENLTDRIEAYRKKSYEKFAKALIVHDDLEKIYIQEMNFDKANKLADLFIEEILQDTSRQNHNPHIFHRLFGTNTDEGPVNKLPQIIEQVQNRVYIKGRAGTGKSVFLNKVIKACMDYGFDVEQYHCSFDPGSTDMVLVPGLDLCVFDSTAPHEFSPDRHNDVVIDLYKETVTPGTDEKYAQEIQRITQKYKRILSEGISDLKKAKYWQDKQEEPYANIDSTRISFITEEVLNSIKE